MSYREFHDAYVRGDLHTAFRVWETWFPLRVTPVEAPSSPVERLSPVPVVGVTPDVRVEHRAGWATEALVYHFDHEAFRWCPP